MIRSPAELIHYIGWRKSLGVGDKVFAVDELDIFGAYLFGHVGREQLGDGEHLNLGSGTTSFDEYYAFEMGNGFPQDKPHRVLGELVEDHLLHLGERRPDLWLDRSFALLDLSLEEAAALSAWFESQAREELGRETWVGVQYGSTVMIALRSDMKYRNVVNKIEEWLPPCSRIVVAKLGKNGPQIVWSQKHPGESENA